MAKVKLQQINLLIVRHILAEGKTAEVDKNRWLGDVRQICCSNNLFLRVIFTDFWLNQEKYWRRVRYVAAVQDMEPGFSRQLRNFQISSLDFEHSCFGLASTKSRSQPIYSNPHMSRREFVRTSSRDCTASSSWDLFQYKGSSGHLRWRQIVKPSVQATRYTKTLRLRCKSWHPSSKGLSSEFVRDPVQRFFDRITHWISRSPTAKCMLQILLKTKSSETLKKSLNHPLF